MGYSVRQGALTLDLTPLNAVRVAPDRRTVTVGGGARLGELYAGVWRQAGNLTTVVAGTCPNVGRGLQLAGCAGYCGGGS